MKRKILIPLLLLSIFLLITFGIYSFQDLKPYESEVVQEYEVVALKPEKVIEETSPLCSPIDNNYNYNDQMGTLTFERGVEAPIIYGNPDDAFVSAMELGSAFDPTSSFPGEDTTTVIAGHKTNEFKELENVEIGDEIILEIDGFEYVYEVTYMEAIEDTDIDKVYYDENDLVLYTCYPFYYQSFYSQRYMVSAELVTEFSC